MSTLIFGILVFHFSHSLIMSCWKDDPAERLTFTQICQCFIATTMTSNAASDLMMTKEESLLDSIMSTISSNEKYVTEMNPDGVQDEYVEVDQQFTLPYNDIREISGKPVTKQNGNIDLCKYATLPSDHQGTSTPRILDRRECKGQDDSYVEMRGQEKSLNIEQLAKERSCLYSNIKHIRQTSATSDYVPMEVATNAHAIYDIAQ